MIFEKVTEMPEALKSEEVLLTRKNLDPEYSEYRIGCLTHMSNEEQELMIEFRDGSSTTNYDEWYYSVLPESMSQRDVKLFKVRCQTDRGYAVNCYVIASSYSQAEELFRSYFVKTAAKVPKIHSIKMLTDELITNGLLGEFL